MNSIQPYPSRWRLLSLLMISVFLFVGCGDDNEDFVFLGALQQAPTSNNDTFPALGNATLIQARANGLLNNDAVNGAAISAFNAASTQGGVVQVNADGSFTYTPPFGFKGVDTFTYTLSNNVGASTATVTLNVTNAGWFVNNSGANGNGSQATPFNNLNAALAMAVAGDTVFVFRGDGNTTNQAGPVDVPAGVNLVGEGQGLVLAQTIVAQGNAPVITGPVTLRGNNTLSGFTINGSPNNGVQANGVSNLIVRNNTLQNSNSRHMSFTDVAGTLELVGNNFGPMDNDNSNVDISTNSINGTYRLNQNTFTDDAASDTDEGFNLAFRGTSMINLELNSNTFNGVLTGFPFEQAVDLDVTDTAQATVTMTGNTFNNVENAARMDTFNTATLTAVLASNMVSNVSTDAFFSRVFGGTMTLTFRQNIINMSGSNGVRLETADLAVNLKAAFRDNTITGSTNSSIFYDAGNNSTMCADITGNTVDDNITFDPSGGSNIDVERFNAATGGPLNTVNTFNSGATVATLGGGTVTPQNAGTCAIP